MKKIIHSFFLIITCCFFIGNLSGLNVNAAVKEEVSGVEISISSDKDEYSAGEDVKIEFSINNKTENALADVNWELNLPTGVKLKNGNSSGKDIKINAGETFNGSAALEGTTTAQTTTTTTTTTKAKQNNVDSAKTGDTFNVFIPLTIIAIAFIVAMSTRKRDKRFFKLFTFFALFTFAASSASLNAFAAENGAKTSKVDKTIKIGGSSYTIGLTVSFEFDTAGSTPANLEDTDGDGLNDNEETTNYQTDPQKYDTDDDGIDDHTEVRFGLNPLIPEKKAEDGTISIAYSPSSDNSKVQATIDISMLPEQLRSFKMDKIPSNDIFISDKIPGYMGEGSAYDFSLDGKFTKAVLTYTLSDELISDADFVPAIYYFNEEDQFLEKQEKAIISNNKVSLELEHFSRYVLVNEPLYNSVWEYEFEFHPEFTRLSSLDVAFVIDVSGSMSWNDPNGKRREVTNNFIDKLTINDRAAIISFESFSNTLSDFTSDKTVLKNAVSNLGCGGGTNLTLGISTALDLFNNQTDNDEKLKSIVFLTDGSGSYNSTYTTNAINSGITIYTVGLGSSVQDNLLRQIANSTGGEYFHADDADNLYHIFDSIFELTDSMKDSDDDGLTDYHEKAMARGELRLGNGTTIYDAEKLTNIDYLNDDSDDDHVKDGDEISVEQHIFTGKVYVKMISNPTIKDTDGDGINDDTDTQPLVYNGTGTPPSLPTNGNGNGNGNGNSTGNGTVTGTGNGTGTNTGTDDDITVPYDLTLIITANVRSTPAAINDDNKIRVLLPGSTITIYERQTDANGDYWGRISPNGASAEWIWIQYCEYERRIYRFLIDEMNYDSTVACGILGNIFIESNREFDPSTIEIGSQEGQGICQWSYDRKVYFINDFCQQRNLTPTDLDSQLQFLKYELQDSDDSYKVFADTTDIDDELKAVINNYSTDEDRVKQAAAIFCNDFERPDDPDGALVEERKTIAYNDFWLRYLNM